MPAPRRRRRRAGRSAQPRRCRPPGSGTTPWSVPEPLEREDLGVYLDPVGCELVEELGPETRRPEEALGAAGVVEAQSVVEEKNVLEGDDVALHAHNLGHVGDV